MFPGSKPQVLVDTCLPPALLARKAQLPVWLQPRILLNSRMCSSSSLPASPAALQEGRLSLALRPRAQSSLISLQTGLGLFLQTVLGRAATDPLFSEKRPALVHPGWGAIWGRPFFSESEFPHPSAGGANSLRDWEQESVLILFSPPLPFQETLGQKRS